MIKKISQTVNEIKKVKFRRDINGIRAIAVLSVILYHADIDLFSAGFLGVDIFFLISGFLISNQIISELNSGQFSFKTFYFKRIKRILPALLYILLLTIPFSYILLSPKALIEYTRSLISSIFFYSNFFFQNLDFYNSSPADYMPLLHTWSLSVEEQFYIIFPIILFVSYRYLNKRLFPIILIIFLFSIFLNSQTVSVAKFYQIQYRAWELALGALIMIISQKIKLVKWEIPGFLLMFSPIFIFDDNWIADFEPKIICLVGTSILLLNRNEKSIFQKVASFNFISKIGLTSYSLYLIHQPFYAFLKNTKYDLSIFENLIGKFLLIVIQIFFATLIYENIEKRYINKKVFKELIVLPVLIIFILIFCFFSIENAGFEDRYKGTSLYEKAIEYSNIEKFDLVINGETCHKTSKDKTVDAICSNNILSENKEVIVVGDSLARSLLTGFLNEIQQNSVSFYTGDSCILLLDRSPSNCVRSDKNLIYKDLSRFENKIFIYFADVRDKLEDNSLQLEETVPETIKYLLKNNYVIVIYPFPEYMDLNVLDQVLKGREEINFPTEKWRNRDDVIRSYKIFENIDDKKYFKILPEDIFCNTFVQNHCVGATNGKIYVQDSIHLTIEGASLLTSEIINILKLINNS